MQIDYGQGVTPRAQPPLYLTQVPHRLALLATLLTAVVLGLSATYREYVYLTLVAVCAAYAAVAAAMIGLVLASRRNLHLRELFGVLIFSLVLAHLTSWSLLDPHGPIKFFSRVGAFFQ